MPEGGSLCLDLQKVPRATGLTDGASTMSGIPLMRLVESSQWEEGTLPARPCAVQVSRFSLKS